MDNGIKSRLIWLSFRRLGQDEKDSRMRLSHDTELFSLAGIPMVGNLITGGIIGLTPEGNWLCHAMAVRNVESNEVPVSCAELVDHLSRGSYLEDDQPQPIPTVRSAYLHVTQRCNLRCRFCYSEDEGRNCLPDPTLDELCRAVDLLASLGVARLVISGGEPFLRDDLSELVSHAKSHGIAEIAVLTNGLLLSEKNVRPLAGLADCIGIAFDGVSAQDEAYLRGQQNYERLVAAVQLVHAAGLRVRIMPTLHARNACDMNRYHALAEELEAELSYSLLTAPMSELSELRLSDEQLRKLGQIAFEQGISCGDDPTANFAARRSCGAGKTTLSVAADGTVYPCHMLHDQRFSMGNAFLDAAEKIIDSPVARAFSGLDVRSFEACDTCDKRILCGGGCRARAVMAGTSISGHDPYCELSSAYYDRLGAQLSRCYSQRR